MSSPPAALLAAVALCAAGAACAGGSPAREPVPTHDGTAPPAICAPPATLRDVSTPTAIVGDGTPSSCTAAALQAAADAGGVVAFDCGPSPVTIPITRTIVFRKETILDGGGT